MDEAHKTRYFVHPGADKMYYDLRDMYWWPGMKKEIAIYGNKEDEESSEDSWSNYLPNAEGINNGNDAIQANQEWFDDHELMKDDDDDIGDLDNNLISKGFKERMSKLIGIPYEKPSTFKSENFEVIKYSFGPVEEYVAIKEYEYDIWVQTEENVSHIYQESFCKKDEGWSLKRTK
ncbi:zf-BED domain-containing protein [Tanacetum coccineum]